MAPPPFPSRESTKPPRRSSTSTWRMKAGFVLTLAARTSEGTALPLRVARAVRMWTPMAKRVLFTLCKLHTFRVRVKTDAAGTVQWSPVSGGPDRAVPDAGHVPRPAAQRDRGGPQHSGGARLLRVDPAPDSRHRPAVPEVDDPAALERHPDVRGGADPAPEIKQLCRNIIAGQQAE